MSRLMLEQYIEKIIFFIIVEMEYRDKVSTFMTSR